MLCVLGHGDPGAAPVGCYLGTSVCVSAAMRMIVVPMLWLALSAPALCQEARGGIGDWQPGDTRWSLRWTECERLDCKSVPLIVLQADGTASLYCEKLRGHVVDGEKAEQDIAAAALDICEAMARIAGQGK
jgi:hypothetical protein